MGNIVLLDDLTINKIAAGEVIERPASVVKEMVENSIDAGAKNIIVEIKNGGISYIKISDDGKGIAQDDLEIAFERHATSKIRSAEDLDTVTSMGFRGEALASIAAIANVEMVSKPASQEIGYKVVVEAGNILEKQETGCRTGTTITVRNLFFNTPVRYKFLKKDYTETGYIEDVITRIALINPNVSIKLINTGKTVIQTNGNGDIKSVIYSIYGKDVANAILKLEYEFEDITINGVVGKPEIARSNRSNQLFFVNGRYIKDKTLTAATEQAYKGLIPIGKFGFVILNIGINPSKVDVNVHPAKLEVRFQEENKIFQAVYHAVKDTLLKGELVANTEKNNEEIYNIIRNNLEETINFEKNITTAKEQTEERTSRYNPEFEEKLKQIMNRNKETNGVAGLFGFRKQNEKQIEEYTDNESKIKTNIIEDLFNESIKNKSLNNIEKVN
ncbi:MAG: DNA mismatch repair endonuclease MutL, partial [Clostridia bacterium]|nr:DNA mismatch repair endonuclease MutL [Clostridia bacterium]